MKEYFIFMANQYISQICNKNTIILVHRVSKRLTDHVIVGMSYTFKFIDLSIQEVNKSRSQMAKGHQLSDNLRTTLTHPHPTQ